MKSRNDPFKDPVDRHFLSERKDWEDFGKILKIMYNKDTKRRSCGEQIRKFIIDFNKKHKHVLNKRL